MATETETETRTVEKETTTTYYLCDKCHGRNHEETTWEDDLNKVVFGATLSIVGQKSGNVIKPSKEVVGEYEYLLCDDCLERAHDYLRDFF